jgi:hypothetical protein
MMKQTSIKKLIEVRNKLEAWAESANLLANNSLFDTPRRYAEENRYLNYTKLVGQIDSIIEEESKVKEYGNAIIKREKDGSFLVDEVKTFI